MASLGDTVQTPYGVGRVVNTEASRGYRTVKVAGEGFSVWLDAARVRTAAPGDPPPNVPYPNEQDLPPSNSSPGAFAPPAPPSSPSAKPAPGGPGGGPGTVTPPTAPFVGGLSQGPTSWGMAGQNLVGYPPGWFGFGWGGGSLWGSGDYNTGQGDTHPANVPYPAMFP